jgi:hypothetical protein
MTVLMNDAGSAGKARKARKGCVPPPFPFAQSQCRRRVVAKCTRADDQGQLSRKPLGQLMRHTVKGHWFLPGGGRETCPVAVTSFAR